MLKGAAKAAVGWFRGRLLLNLLVVAVMLEGGRLRVAPISGMPANVLEGGAVAAMPVGPVRGENRGNEKRRLTNSCVLTV